MDLITRLKAERDGQVHGGIYDITQKRFAYNSNKIKGSRLTEEQTSFIYETKTIANIGGVGIKIDDLVETTNHFKCFDYVLDSVDEPLTEEYILKLHRMLKSGTSSENNPIAPVGKYKVLENEVGQIATASVEHTDDEMFIVKTETSKYLVLVFFRILLVFLNLFIGIDSSQNFRHIQWEI